MVWFGSRDNGRRETLCPTQVIKVLGVMVAPPSPVYVYGLAYKKLLM